MAERGLGAPQPTVARGLIERSQRWAYGRGPHGDPTTGSMGRLRNVAQVVWGVLNERNPEADSYLALTYVVGPPRDWQDLVLFSGNGPQLLFDALSVSAQDGKSRAAVVTGIFQVWQQSPEIRRSGSDQGLIPVEQFWLGHLLFAVGGLTDDKTEWDVANSALALLEGLEPRDAFVEDALAWGRQMLDHNPHFQRSGGSTAGIMPAAVQDLSQGRTLGAHSLRFPRR